MLLESYDDLEEAKIKALEILKEEIERALSETPKERDKATLALLKSLEAVIDLALSDDPEESAKDIVRVMGVVRAAASVNGLERLQRNVRVHKWGGHPKK